MPTLIARYSGAPLRSRRPRLANSVVPFATRKLDPTSTNSDGPSSNSRGAYSAFSLIANRPRLRRSVASISHAWSIVGRRAPVRVRYRADTSSCVGPRLALTLAKSTAMPLAAGLSMLRQKPPSCTSPMRKYARGMTCGPFDWDKPCVMPWLATKSSNPGSGAGSPTGVGMTRPLEQAGSDTSADASWGDRAAPSRARFRQDGRHVNWRRTAASAALAHLGKELRLLLAA